ncbi:hypothetical protein PVAG01_05606 [Phlyctema vagabunda]|uniref:Uncharacterized protein n=1 Tax=Phlyctema vagabunda TaxID=108571 RepID=A0ABR4PKI5_9HELO
MPPHLDLTGTSTHANMILSARSPRMSLRRTGSYNAAEKGPLSSTSSRFSFNHLIVSPPPSPSLPALVPRHGRISPVHTPRRCLRVALWLSGVLVIVYFGFIAIKTDHSVPSVGWSLLSGEQYEMVEESELPDYPTPVVVTDKRGRAKWTVSIPPDQPFPLAPQDYAMICSQNMEVANHVRETHSHKPVSHGHFGYYYVDPNFMDVHEAEEHGLLPGPKANGKTSMVNGVEGNIIGEKKDSLIETEVCQKSLTFVMETHDAGLGKTLMMLWMAFGLAQKEERSFFIEDSRWAYGSYTNYFLPPPDPGCRPPPRHEMLPCPHHARHLVVSAATVSYTFGGAFNEEFENPKKMEVMRQRPMFEMAREGYEGLFNLAGTDAQYVESRILDLQSKTMMPPPDTGSGLVIGVHVRHGDRRPYEFQYKDSYVPLERYSDMARDFIYDTFNSSGADGGEDLMAEMKSILVVASDDPDVYDSDEFSHAYRAQEQIKLASKKTLVDPTKEKPAKNVGMRKFEDEAVGWEGGFFAPMFWSLGRPINMPTTAIETPDTQLAPSSEALRLREFVGRAYLMDLAVLGRSSDITICTISSMGCRLLAIMMGWEKAIEQKKHVNIDGDFHWRGVEWGR